MQPRTGTGIGANVVFARANPSSPTIATVLYVHALAVPFASRAANSSVAETLGAGCDDGVGFAVGDATADGVAIAVALGVDGIADGDGEITDDVSLGACPQAATSRMIAARPIALMPARTVERGIGFSQRREA